MAVIVYHKMHHIKYEYDCYTFMKSNENPLTDNTITNEKHKTFVNCPTSQIEGLQNDIIMHKNIKLDGT